MAIPVSSNLTPGGSAFPVTEAQYVKGAMQIVADETARDALVASRRAEGQVAYCIDSGKTFRLVGGTDNANWVDCSPVQIGTDDPPAHAPGNPALYSLSDTSKVWLYNMSAWVKIIGVFLLLACGMSAQAQPQWFTRSWWTTNTANLTPGAAGTNLLTAATAADARTAMGLGIGVTNLTAAEWRSTLGLGEWATNLNFGFSNDYGQMWFGTAAGDSTMVGLRFAGGPNTGLLSANSSLGGLVLTDAEGTGPLVISSPGPATVINMATLTNDVRTNPSTWRSRLAVNEAVTNTTPAGLELAATAGRTESEIVDRLVRTPRVKSAPVYVRRMMYDYPESSSVPNQHAAYQVIVPTPTSGEYAIYGFRQGVAQGCITLQSIGIGALVSTNVGTESGTWYDMDIYKPWSGRRTSSAGGYVEWTDLVGTSLAVAFLNSINVGYCGVSIDGDDTLANCLPAATEANYTDIGVDVGDRYWDGYTSSPKWKWALIATNLPNTAHTVRLTHLGKKNTSSSDTRIAVLRRGCGVVGAGTYSTSEFADFYTHCSSLGQFNQLSAFVGVMLLTNITCADSDFLGDYHTVHSDHLTQTNGTESITVDGVVQSMTAGGIVRGYDIKIVTTAQLMEEVGGMITNICAKTVVWQFGARAGEEQCRVTLTHTWDIDTDIRIFYAAVLPHYQRWRPTYGYDYTYSKWVQNGTAYDIPTDDSWLGRYTPTATSAYLAGDKSYALTALDGIGSPEIWEAVGGQTGAGIYHACQGRSSYVAKTYVSSVHNVAAFRATSGTTTTYNYGLSAGTVLDYSSLAYLLGL